MSNNFQSSAIIVMFGLILISVGIMIDIRLFIELDFTDFIKAGAMLIALFISIFLYLIGYFTIKSVFRK